MPTRMLKHAELLKRPRPTDPFLRQLLEAIRDAPIVEQQIEHDRLWVFGHHDPRDGQITLNVPLMRVVAALHELTHRVRPDLSERAVRAKTTHLLHTLDDECVRVLNAALLEAIAEG